MTVQEALDKALSLGCKPEVDGSWVKFTPPPPTDLLLDLLGKGGEIAAILAAKAARK